LKNINLKNVQKSEQLFEQLTSLKLNFSLRQGKKLEQIFETLPVGVDIALTDILEAAGKMFAKVVDKENYTAK